MPFAIKKFGSGFKVCDKKRCFSNAPLSYGNAVKQRVAIALSEHKKNPKKTETKEATSTSSSGQYSGPAFGAKSMSPKHWRGRSRLERDDHS